jgi:hypothetical protein
MEDDVEQELPTLPGAHGLIPGLFCVVLLLDLYGLTSSMLPFYFGLSIWYSLTFI